VYERQFLAALCLSLATESLIVAAIFRALRRPIGRAVLVCVIGTALTLPYVWFVLPPFLPGEHAMRYAELFAVTVEAILYSKFIPCAARDALLLSIAANAASYGIGRMTATF
jgi:hypothetical protein